MISLQDILYGFTTAFVALFPVINPIGNSFVVNGFIHEMDEDDRKMAVKKIFLNCLVIGLGSIVIGHLVMLLFGLAIPVIQVGGGIIICKTGLEWLSGKGTMNQKIMEVSDETMQKLYVEDVKSKLFYPISFPICLGPGSISVIFTLMANSSVRSNVLQSVANYVTIAVVIFLILLILYVLLMQGRLITRRLGNSGNLIINKLVAFITFCVGIQILVTGISKIFHLTIL